ncbi:MAG: DUF2202 domain-containing protein [Haliscomenobacter sp.]
MKKQASHFVMMSLLLGSGLFLVQCQTDLGGNSNQDFYLYGRGGNGQGFGNGNQGNASSQNPEATCTCLATNYPVETLSEEERNQLLHMREEEKLALNVYQVLAQKWGLALFSNIAQSEQTHTETVACLLDKYGLEDPAANTVAGVFLNAELQKLYDALVAEGSTSLLAALKVGATIEDLDIADLHAASAQADNRDILAVYAELTKGSRNHMRSFAGLITNYGAAYIPQFIAEEEYQTIMSTARETGSGLCKQ